MSKITKITLVLAIIVPIAVWAQCLDCPTPKGKSGDHIMKSTVSTSNNPKLVAVPLPGYNKAVQLADGKYFTYDFSKKPKIGTAILNVHVYDKKKRHSDDYDVYITADMPSMRGAHASGDVKMKANKKGVLMAPVNFVMLGVWEITLNFYKDGKHTHSFKFEQKI